MSGGESFTLVLAAAAPVDELEAFMRDAAPGAKAVYASGFDLPREAAGVKLAHRLAGEGRVRLHQARDRHDPRRWQYLMVVRGAPQRLGRERDLVRPSTCCLDGDHTRAQLKALLAVLREAAASGRTCPSYSAQAKALGLPANDSGRRRARHLFARLAEEGRIAVQRGDHASAHVVTILAPGRARGKRTGSNPGEKA